MLGTVSFLNWKVTVISSNFISLMLILTLSMTIHIIVRYRKVLVSNPLKARHFKVAQNMMEMIRPCIFTTLTTIFAFGTLYLSNIKPTINTEVNIKISVSVEERSRALANGALK